MPAASSADVVAPAVEPIGSGRSGLLYARRCAIASTLGERRAHHSHAHERIGFMTWWPPQYPPNWLLAWKDSGPSRPTVIQMTVSVRFQESALQQKRAGGRIMNHPDPAPGLLHPSPISAVTDGALLLGSHDLDGIGERSEAFNARPTALVAFDVKSTAAPIALEGEPAVGSVGDVNGTQLGQAPRRGADIGQFGLDHQRVIGRPRHQSLDNAHAAPRILPRDATGTGRAAWVGFDADGFSVRAW